MDKYEYRIRAEEINDLIEKKEYAQAVKIADTIDWRRVRSVVMLCKISELYKINRRYEDSKEVLLLAYELQSNSRKIIYSLCELCIKLDEIVEALEYYKEFIKVAPRDTGRFILQYRIYTAQDVSLEERIAVLVEYQRREYREKWMYELAYLYHRIGLETSCIEQCDDIFVWFHEGKYVIKALELKMLHAPLSPEQQEVYNARFMVQKQEEEPVKLEEEQTGAEITPSLSIEIKSIEATKAKTEEIPSKKVNEQIEEPVITDSYVQEEPDIYMQDVPVYETEEPEEIMEETEDFPAEEPIEEETGVSEEMPIVDTSGGVDIQVKTIDVGDEYNTINLQDELAKNLAEILAQEDMEASDATRALPIDSIFAATKEIPEEVVEEVSEEVSEEIFEEELPNEDFSSVEEIHEIGIEPSEEVIADSQPEEEIYAAEVPVAELEEYAAQLYEQETENLVEEYAEELTEEITEEIVEEPAEEIMEEPAEEPIEEIMEEPEEEPIEEIEEEPVEEPIKETPVIEPLVFNQNQPLPEALIQAVQSAAMQAATEAAKQAAAEAAKQAAQATAEAMKEIKPEENISEEVQEQAPEEMVEKQITGQLSFSDIMAEWEETKKANEEKHLQEMKQRVMEQTGPLLSDFDAAARASVQSDLDMLSPMLEVFPEENAEEVEAEVSPVTENEIEEELVSVEDVAEEELVSEIEEALAEPVEEVEEITEEQEEEPEHEDRPSSFNTEEIIGLEEKLMDALEGQHYDTANLQAEVLETEMAKQPEVSDAVKMAAAAAISAMKAEKKEEKEEVKEEVKPEENRMMEVLKGPRTLTLEEKSLFGGIAPNKELQEKVAEVLDKASLIPYTNNIIISGERETGTMETAEKLAKYYAQANRSFSGKVKKFSSEEFTGKDIFAIVNEMPNGIMIIDNAGEMSADLCNKMIKAGNEMENGGILYILVDTVSGIERLGRTYAKITEYFNLRIDISALDNDGLVKYGKLYAREKEFSIDDMGVLALYNRIEERQTNEHAVTVDEVKEIIDQAIMKAEKKSISHFMDTLLSKRYDKEDMIVLREKDFIND